MILFGIPDAKDAHGSDSKRPGIVQQALRAAKSAPKVLVITDDCFCEYTDHGHCGVLNDERTADVDNDATLALLASRPSAMPGPGPTWSRPAA